MAKVIAFRGGAASSMVEEEPPAPQPETPCVVCGLPMWTNDRQRCDRCGAMMHTECYFGRVLTMGEWQRWAQLMLRDEADSLDGLDRILKGWISYCPACRLAVELGDT